MKLILKSLRTISLCLLFSVTVFLSCLKSQELPKTSPGSSFHLTSKPWNPLNIEKEEYLEVLEGILRVAEKHQNEEGAIIDPYLKREHQYSTPYFGMAVGVLIKENRAKDLWESGIQAIEHSTKQFSKCSEGIPDRHGEFFIAPLVESLQLYKDEIDIKTYQKWEERLKIPISKVIRPNAGSINNWRTYAMKGEWMRAKYGLISREKAISISRWTRTSKWKNGQSHIRGDSLSTFI